MKIKNRKGFIGLVVATALLFSSLNSTLAQNDEVDFKVAIEKEQRILYDKDSKLEFEKSSTEYDHLPDTRSIDFSKFDLSSLTSVTDNQNIDIVELSVEIQDNQDFLFNEKSRNYSKTYEMNDITSIQEKSSTSDLRSRSSTTSRNSSNTDPNSAIFLSSMYYGYELYDLADDNERWYYFSVTGNDKVSVNFLQDSDGDYDLLLYKLDGSTLYLVDYSAQAGVVEKINYIADNGIYFLQIAPYTAAVVPYYFTFVLDVISGFDAYEPNDDISGATNFINNIVSLSANIDNPFDEDWYGVNITATQTKEITVSNAPSGNHYAVFVYDSSFNTIGSYYVNGSDTRNFDFSAGQYYIRILSMTGVYSLTNYSLNFVNFIPGTLLASGHRVLGTGNQLLINGQPAIINGMYMEYNYYSYRVSEAIYFVGNSLMYDSPLTAYSHTYYTDGIGWRTSPVIFVYIMDGYYNCYNGQYGYWSWYFDTDPNRPLGNQTTTVPYLVALVDLNTGRVVDNIYSMHYTSPFYNIQWNNPTPIV